MESNSNITTLHDVHHTKNFNLAWCLKHIMGSYVTMLAIRPHCWKSLLYCILYVHIYSSNNDNYCEVSTLSYNLKHNCWAQPADIMDTRYYDNQTVKTEIQCICTKFFSCIDTHTKPSKSRSHIVELWIALPTWSIPKWDISIIVIRET